MEKFIKVAIQIRGFTRFWTYEQPQNWQQIGTKKKSVRKEKKMIRKQLLLGTAFFFSIDLYSALKGQVTTKK